MHRVTFSILAAVVLIAFGCANNPPSMEDPRDLGNGEQVNDTGGQPDTVVSDTETSSDQGDSTIEQDPNLEDGSSGDSEEWDLDTSEGWPSCVVTSPTEICGNGLDDNCNGLVDEGCTCAPEGSTQACYPGNPAELEGEHTWCRAGIQECRYEFWYDCVGARGPEEEVCDGIDNNCNGIVDEGCETEPPEARCPADFEGPVLHHYDLLGEYHDPNAVPMIFAAWTLISAPPGCSYDLWTSGLELNFFADVTGEYVFRLTVENADFEQASCQTVFTATTEDVLRIELTWNRPDGEDYVACPATDLSDLDLFLRRNPVGNFSYYNSNDTCYWKDCATCTERYNIPAHDRERLCRAFLATEPPEAHPADHPWPLPRQHWGDVSDPRSDPRLDLDDTAGCGPENINVRQPDAGTYRVTVHYYDANQISNPDADARVRVICESQEIFLSEAVTLRAYGEYHRDNEVWEVGDVIIDYTQTPPCRFEQFGSAGSRRICAYNQAEPGGCP